MNRLESGLGLTLLAAALLSSAAFPAYADARSDALQALPENARALYTDAVDVGAAQFADFKAPAKPWRWCHSESYMGNPWRVTFNDELARLVNGAKEAGDVSEFIVSDSNGDTTQQISQIRSFYRKGLLGHHHHRRLVDGAQCRHR